MALQTGKTLMGVTWWLVIMTVLAVILRFWAKNKATTRIASDDWMMLAAAILLFASQVLLSVVYAYGLGQTDDLTLKQQMNIFKFQWIYVIPANMSSIFSRISIAILLSRIFSVKRWFRWYLAVTTFIAACLVTTLLIELWTSCTPVSALWDPRLKETARCLDPKVFSRIGDASQGMLTITDITFVLFPVIFIWKLNMAMKRKVVLVIVFCLGLLTAVASLMKMILVQSTSSQHSKISSTIPSLIWSTVEASMVIIIGCVPTFGPLTRLQFPSIRSYWSKLQSSTLSGPTELSKTITPSRDSVLISSKTVREPQKVHMLDSGFKSSVSLQSRSFDCQFSTTHV